MKNSLITLAVIAALSAMPAIYGQETADSAAPKKEKKSPIAMADKDGDGMLSKEEFATLPMNAKAPEGVDAKFAELDKDGDGKLTADELKASAKGKDKKDKGKKEKSAAE